MGRKEPARLADGARASETQAPGRIMPDPGIHPLETILRRCAEAAPEPWYPSVYAKSVGISRDALDPHLDRLRMAGLVRLTDWVQGQGQGYALTPAGDRVLESPRDLARLRQGQLPPARGEWFEPQGPNGRGRSAWDRGEAVREALLTPSTPVVTYTLLVVNIAVFLAEIAPGFTPPVVDTLGLSGAGLVRGEWWRLLTHCFVHGGPLHIAMNMYALYVIGPIGERMWGRWSFLALYLIAGLGGGCAALVLKPNVNLVGASGALCGIMAGEAIWVLLNRSYLPPPLFWAWIRNIAINTVLIGLISYVPGVSGAAHGGGAVVGALTALILSRVWYGGAWERWPGLVALLLVPVAVVGLLVRTMDTSLRWKAFRESQEMADLNGGVSRAVRAARQDAARLYNTEVVPLLNQHPTRRDPQAVEKAIADLSKQKTALDEAVGRLAKAGPYHSARAEEERQAKQQQLEDLMKLLDLSERCLRQGEAWTERDERALEEQQDRVQGAGP
jgi:membrane associated rhomboid family serine protease